MGRFYPSDVCFDWNASSAPLRFPVVRGGRWIYPVPLEAQKWLVRARSGALATGARLFKVKLRTSSSCIVCGEDNDDDVHTLTGCKGTGTADVDNGIQAAWRHVLSPHLDNVVLRAGC